MKRPISSEELAALRKGARHVLRQKEPLAPEQERRHARTMIKLLDEIRRLREGALPDEETLSAMIYDAMWRGYPWDQATKTAKDACLLAARSLREKLGAVSDG